MGMGIERALAFLALALLAEVAGTVGGFGSSTFFVPIAGFFFDFQSVLGITALFHLLSNLSKLGLFRGGIDARLLLTLGVPSVAFAVLGSLATPHLPVVALKIALAVFLIVFSALLLRREECRLPPTPWAAALGCALSGGMAGLVGTGGAVRGLTLAAFALPKDGFVATSAAIDTGISWRAPASTSATATSTPMTWYGSRCWAGWRWRAPGSFAACFSACRRRASGRSRWRWCSRSAG